MGLVVLVLIASAGWALKKQTTALAAFTDRHPIPAPVTKVQNHETEVNSLVSRLAHFGHEVENQRPVEIALSVDDLNLAISQFKPLKGFRKQLSVDTISEQIIIGRIHLPLNSTEKLPTFVTSLLKIERRPNNLNGTFTAVPTLTDGKLILTLQSVTPAQGQLPRPFLAGISRILISGDLPEDSSLQRILSKLTSVELRGEQLILSYHPDTKPPSAMIEADAMATKAKQFAALGAVILILTMILTFILISRWQRNRTATHEG